LSVGVNCLAKLLCPVEYCVSKQLPKYPDEEAQFRDDPHYRQGKLQEKQQPPAITKIDLAR
jgi:hypothetical protein